MKSDVAWAAGFLEGDGHVCLLVDKYAAVGAKQITPEPLYVLQELFGGAVYPRSKRLVCSLHKQKCCARCSATWEWTVYGARAIACVRMILPLTKTKAKREKMQKVLSEAVTRPLMPARTREATRLRRGKVIALREQGLTFVEIAVKTGYKNGDTACSAYHRGVAWMLSEKEESLDE